VCLSVCLSAAVRPHYYTDPDVTWQRGRGCPLVVHCWADLQSGHGLRCYGNITRTLVTSLHPSRDMTIDDIVRTAGWAGSARAAGRRRERPQNRAPHTGSGRGRPAGDRPSTGGILNITAADWTAGFHWWRSGNKKRTQNASEYMLVLALCRVVACNGDVKTGLLKRSAGRSTTGDYRTTATSPELSCSLDLRAEHS